VRALRELRVAAIAFVRGRSWLDASEALSWALEAWLKGWRTWDGARGLDRRAWSAYKARKGMRDYARRRACSIAKHAAIAAVVSPWSALACPAGAELAVAMRETGAWERLLPPSRAQQVEPSQWQERALALFRRGW